MTGTLEEAAAWFSRAAAAYRDSHEGAPKESWGRPIGAIKARLLADDRPGAAEDARWALGLGASSSDSPIGRYAATLALLVLGDDPEAAALARTLCEEPEGRFPSDVAGALLGLAERDARRYGDSLEETLRSFELRDRHLEGVPVADTVLVLEALAEQRAMARRPRSALLPPRADRLSRLFADQSRRVNG
jgi:hypothetical protein